MEIRTHCPRCRSKRIVKNGTHPVWKDGRVKRVQYMLCNNCGKQFLQRREG